MRAVPVWDLGRRWEHPFWAITHGGWERGFVLASRPLTNEKRRDLEPGRLLVIRDGTAVYGVAGF